jgi:hypothetical protein
LWYLLPKYKPIKNEIRRIISFTPGKVLSLRIWHKISKNEKKIMAPNIGIAIDSAKCNDLKLRMDAIITDRIVITSPCVSTSWTLNIYKNMPVITIAYDIVVNIANSITVAAPPRKHKDMPEIESTAPKIHSSILIYSYFSILASKLSIKLTYFSSSKCSGISTFSIYVSF